MRGFNRRQPESHSMFPVAFMARQAVLFHEQLFPCDCQGKLAGG